MDKLSFIFIDPVGIQCHGDTPNQIGLGGSESAYIFMARELVKLGCDVIVYNRCDKEGVYDGVEYQDISYIINEDRKFDILVMSRTVLPFLPAHLYQHSIDKYGFNPEPFKTVLKNSKHRVLWLHDTFIRGDEFMESVVLDGFFDEIFTLSDWHTHYITKAHHEGAPRRFEQLKRKIFQTRNGINNYKPFIDVTQKDPDLFIYNASITKGMPQLLEEIWPEIYARIPTAKLIVIGGYYVLFKDDVSEWQMMWAGFKSKYEGTMGIHFTGIIKQKDIADILEKASFFIYPNTFPETFGISTLECINYNVITIGHRFGALEEIASDDCSYLIEYGYNEYANQKPRFVDLVLRAHADKHRNMQKQNACNKFKPWIGWDKVALEWKEHLMNKVGKFMDPAERLMAREATYQFNHLFKRKHVNEEAKPFNIRHLNENQIIVISPFYNAEAYIANNIKSVANQIYDNYKHILIDDMSTDSSYAVAEQTIKALPPNIQDRFMLIKNDRKKYALGNQIFAINSVIDSIKELGEDMSNRIVALLDGDDWLVNNADIFSYLSYMYDTYGLKFTYGSCHSIIDNLDLIAQPYPPEVHTQKNYRNYLFPWGMPYTHLRTFDLRLCDGMDFSEVFDGDTVKFKTGADNYLFYELIEKCEPHEIKDIGEILVMYNDANPLNDYKVAQEAQNENARIIRTRERVEFDTQKGHTLDFNDVPNIEKIKTNIVGLVRQKDPTAIKLYKQIAENRINVWMDTENITESARALSIKRMLEEKFEGRKNIKILDLGAWSGTVAQYVADNGYTDITCMDISKEIIKLGSTHRPWFRWVQGDVEQLTEAPFGDKYDAIFAFEMLEHLVEPFALLEKAQHWLNPGGAIFFTIPTEDYVFGYPGDNVASEHISRITKDELKHLGAIFNILTATINNKVDFEWYTGYIPKKEGTEPVRTQVPKGVTAPYAVPVESAQPAKKTTVLIAVPTARYIEADTFKSIYRLIIPEGVTTHLEFFYGYNIAQIRNLISNFAIINNFDYVLNIDSDIVVPPNALVELLKQDKDIIGGAYLQRINGQRNLEAYEWTPDMKSSKRCSLERMSEKNPIEMSSVGFGCTLVSTKCLKDVGYPQFEYINALDHNQTVSEDTIFCIKAKNKGYITFLLPTIQCGHIGQFEHRI